MTDKQIIIDDYFRKIVDINGEIVDYEIKNSDVSKLVQKIEKYNSYIEHKEQECEELKNELHKNFEEKDKLHLIIDRLLEASGYDTNTASAEDFEDVYENMRYKQQQLDQLKVENEDLKNFHINLVGVKECEIRELLILKQTLAEIKEIAERRNYLDYNECLDDILQKISESEADNDKTKKTI